jgi:hypothetical protein
MFDCNEWMDGLVGASSIIVTDWLDSTLKTAVVSSEDTIK